MSDKAPLKLSKPVLCIVGPTASGKSELAQLFAEARNGEVVSADSMQIYRGMDIGTGKVLPTERRVRHYGLDLIDPGAPFSASLYQEYARKCFTEIDSRGSVSVLCGGTGFYVRSAIDDYDFPKGEQESNPVREKYLDLYQKEGALAVWDVLNSLDPPSAKAIHPNNVKRVIRALEMYEEGVSYAEQVDKLKSIRQIVPCVMVGLSVERETLYQRINNRVDKMFSEGLVDEVSSLLNKGFSQGLTSQQAIGYKEVVEYLEGRDSLLGAKEKIKMATRRYAKRQISWFKGDKRINWIDATSCDEDRLLSECLAVWDNNLKQ